MNKPLTSDEIFRFRENMFTDLRMELDQLKACQSNSVFWGIAGSTGVITLIGVASNLTVPELACFFLIPLLIVFPAWMIFFDKARTIYRLTGFFRLQEKLAVINSDEGLIGWESALEKFWAKQELFQQDPNFIRDENLAIESITKSRRRITSHVYLWMVYFVFFLMAVLTFALCVRQIANLFVFLFIAITSLYLNLFFFISFKRKVSPVYRAENKKTSDMQLALYIFEISDLVASFVKKIASILNHIFQRIWDRVIIVFSLEFDEKEPKTDTYPEKSSFDKSFRGFLDDLISSEKVNVAVNILFLIALSVNYFYLHYYPQIAPSFTTLLSLIIFTAFLAFFSIPFLITMYIFLNLIRGRYTINAYEFRWKNVLELNT
jgi:hypothetical protein